MKRLLLIVDMEGVAGVDKLSQITAGTAGYEAARRLLTAETNAAIAGFAEAGFDEVVVSDSHAGGSEHPNIVESDLDGRARLAIKDDAYEASLFQDVDAVACIGMHAAANTDGFVAHTVSIHCDWLRNGQRQSEADIVVALAAEAGVPVLLISGDDVLCASMDPRIATVVTKHSLSPMQCRSGPVEEVRTRLHHAAASVAISEVPSPVQGTALTIRFKSLWQADRAVQAGARRISDYGVEVDASSVRETYSKAVELMGVTFHPVMAAFRGSPGSAEMLEDLEEVITRPVPDAAAERRPLSNGNVEATLAAFLRQTESSSEFARALRALVLHIAETWAPHVFSHLRMQPLLDQVLNALGDIPPRFPPTLKPADGMSRVDAWFIYHRRGLACTAPGPQEFSAYLHHLDAQGYALHAWLLGEMAANVGMDVRLRYPARMFRGRSRLWDLYWLTHEFFLATDFMRQPVGVRSWATQLEELAMATPWAVDNGHADLAAELALCMQMAGEYAAPRHHDLLEFLRSSQGSDGVLYDGSMGDPPETMADHATGLLFLVYAGVEEWNEQCRGN